MLTKYLLSVNASLVIFSNENKKYWNPINFSNHRLMCHFYKTKKQHEFSLLRYHFRSPWLKIQSAFFICGGMAIALHTSSSSSAAMWWVMNCNRLRLCLITVFAMSFSQSKWGIFSKNYYCKKSQPVINLAV